MNRLLAYLLAIFILTSTGLAVTKEAGTKYPKLKVWVSTYYADHWSDTGRYRQVSNHGKRIGNFVALNFLPGGSIIMLPRLFDSTTFEVADTFGGSGFRTVKGRRYWKVDVLRNHNEWYDNHDFPVDLYIVKYNKPGQVKNRVVKNNCLAVYKQLYLPKVAFKSPKHKPVKRIIIVKPLADKLNSKGKQ
jgi:hypothetical protein